MDFLTDLFERVYNGLLYPLLSFVLAHVVITLLILAVLIVWVGMTYKGRLR
jgi:hypothetical protein